jgi:hypothetical protein
VAKIFLEEFWYFSHVFQLLCSLYKGRYSCGITALLSPPPSDVRFKASTDTKMQIVFFYVTTQCSLFFSTNVSQKYVASIFYSTARCQTYTTRVWSFYHNVHLKSIIFQPLFSFNVTGNLTLPIRQTQNFPQKRRYPSNILQSVITQKNTLWLYWKIFIHVVTTVIPDRYDYPSPVIPIWCQFKTVRRGCQLKDLKVWAVYELQETYNILKCTRL